MPTLVDAAMNHVNPLTSESRSTFPINCHEAVLGWLLISLNYPRPWRLLRKAVQRDGNGTGNPLQFQGDWMWNKIYKVAHKLSKATVHFAKPGDILCSGIFGRPTHSMVVVSSLGGAVNIRGFNNAGTFLHLNPKPGYMTYDNIDRNVADDDMWNVSYKHTNGFSCVNNELFCVRGEEAQKNVAQLFPWENSARPVKQGPRWHFNFIQGWHWS